MNEGGGGRVLDAGGGRSLREDAMGSITPGGSGCCGGGGCCCTTAEELLPAAGMVVGDGGPDIRRNGEVAGAVESRKEGMDWRTTEYSWVPEGLIPF